jgi:hypothetical protein
MADIRRLRVRCLQLPSAVLLLLVLTLASCTGAPASQRVSELTCAAIRWPTSVPAQTTEHEGASGIVKITGVIGQLVLRHLIHDTHVDRTGISGTTGLHTITPKVALLVKCAWSHGL